MGKLLTWKLCIILVIARVKASLHIVSLLMTLGYLLVSEVAITPHLLELIELGAVVRR